MESVTLTRCGFFLGENVEGPRLPCHRVRFKTITAGEEREDDEEEEEAEEEAEEDAEGAS
jgi:hypothetical protein